MDSFIYMVTQQTLKDQKERRAMGEEFHRETQLESGTHKSMRREMVAKIMREP